MSDFHDFGLTWKCQIIFPCGCTITSKGKIHVVWNFFYTPGTLQAPTFRKNFKQRWFLPLRQTVHCPTKMDFFRFLAHCANSFPLKMHNMYRITRTFLWKKKEKLKTYTYNFNHHYCWWFVWGALLKMIGLRMHNFHKKIHISFIFCNNIWLTFKI